jgi:hypothetical protein
MKAFSVIFFLLGIVSALYEGFHLTAHFQGKDYSVGGLVLLIIGYVLALLPEKNGK